MPRPADVTDEMISEWERDLEENPPDDVPSFMLKSPKIREVFFAGNWLGSRLEAMGVDEDTRGDICFSAGQKMVFSPDPWAVAVETLERFEAGDGYDEPGPELADRLNEENLRA